MNETFGHLKNIFSQSIDLVNPYKIVKQKVHYSDGQIILKENDDVEIIDISMFEKIFLIGAGKAAYNMACALERKFRSKITNGIITVKYGLYEKFNRMKIIEAGHPIPDENSIKAAKEIVELCKEADERTLFVNLISGGASALLTYPMEYKDINISLEEVRVMTELLLKSGATINEINCVRKHISRIKGGRLTELMYPAASINIILSDVVGDNLNTIGSGLTVPDNTTYSDAYEILEKYKLKDKMPRSIVKIIQAGIKNKIKDTPGRDDECFKNTTTRIIGANISALYQAKKTAEELGYNAMILSSLITGEAREIAKFFLSIAKEIKRNDIPVKKPACIIAGGETTVVVKGRGKGGRNQEMALSFANEMNKDRERCDGIYFLSASTDGNDGPTDAAGAFASLDVLNAGEFQGLDIKEYLENNDSYNYFNKIDFLLKSGLTGTNVCDIQLIIII